MEHQQTTTKNMDNKRLRRCQSCPDGKNLIVHNKNETFCRLQKLFMSSEASCMLRLQDEAVVHEESARNRADNRNGKQKESHRWNRGELPSTYLDGTPFIRRDTRKHPVWSFEEHEKFVELYNAGYSPTEIAEKMDKSVHSIITKMKHYRKKLR